MKFKEVAELLVNEGGEIRHRYGTVWSDWMDQDRFEKVNWQVFDFLGEWEHRGIEQTKKLIKLYAYVEGKVRHEGGSYSHLVFSRDSESSTGNFRLPSLDQEIEVDE